MRTRQTKEREEERPRRRRRRRSSRKRGVPAVLGVLLIASWLLPELTLSHLRRADRLVSAGLHLAYGQSPGPRSEVERVRLRIDRRRAVARVDPRFLSVALDTSLLVGGRWWSKSGEVEVGRGSTHVQPFDWSRPKLRLLARALSPAYLRVGGTEADHTWYDLHAAGEAEGTLPPGYELRLTAAQWDALAHFTQAAGLDLFFTLNAGPGPRDAQGHWQARNTEALLRHARDRGHRVPVWELGNEINGYWFIHGLEHQPSAEQYAADMRSLRELVSGYFPESRIAGPSSAFFPLVGEPAGFGSGLLEGFLQSGGSYVDIVTWHYYPQQSRRCPVATRPAHESQLLVPAHLAEVERWAKLVRSAQLRWAPAAEVWLGETGNAQCGGEPGVSDRYVSGLWWLDQLGRLARLGQQVTVRQALVGSNYGLLDEDTLEPRPDYFNSLLWKRLMGERVLAVDRSGDNPYLHAYAHCSANDRGAVSLLLINTHPSLPAQITLDDPNTAGRAYYLSASRLRSGTLKLNSEPLQLSGGQLPLLEGTYQELGATAPLRLEPTQYLFLELPQPTPACGK